MRLIGREPDAVEHVFAEPGRPREHYDIPLVLLVEMLRRRDGLSVRAATRKASALTIGKAIRLFPQSENTLRKRYQRDCKTLGVQMLLKYQGAEGIRVSLVFHLLKKVLPEAKN